MVRTAHVRRLQQRTNSVHGHGTMGIRAWLLAEVQRHRCSRPALRQQGETLWEHRTSSGVIMCTIWTDSSGCTTCCSQTMHNKPGLKTASKKSSLDPSNFLVVVIAGVE